MMKRRTFQQIRKSLVRELTSKDRNLNQLARAAGVSWKTAENHLIYLIGRGYVIKVVDSPYVKIFRITEKGKRGKRNAKL